ncbi:MAG: hypothetical protein LIO78_03965 [Clostridiales bacterium]|nr:hypothetical protein [Clostridiales bacterium]
MCKTTETFAPIAPADGWHRFMSEAETVEYLQKAEIGLLPKTADTLRPIIYRGLYSDGLQVVQVLGYIDEYTLVIALDGQPHCISAAYLLEMQTGRKKALEQLGLGDAACMRGVDCPTYCVIDVETPNHRNDRISSIGLALIVEGCITETRNYLVNPEVEFDEFNSQLTGLTTLDVQDSPTLPEVWAEISNMVTGSIVVAHNAPFDLTVLCKALAAYGIVCPPLDYFDTVRLARFALSGLPNHRLDTLCRYYNITLNHHQADSDSLACAQIFMRLQSWADAPATWDWTAKAQHSPSVHHTQRNQSVPIHTQPLVTGKTDLDGKRVCLSGEFVTGKKADVAVALEREGAIICPGVNKKLDYLIIGEMGSDAWSGGSAGGTKIKRAVELQNQGVPVKIIREHEIFALSETEV